MKSNTTQKWIIGVGNSKTDTVHINQATGTEEEIRELLIKLVEKDKKTDITSWQYGTEDTEKLQRSISGICAYGRYEYYRITYQAIPLTNIPDIGEQSIIQDEAKQTEGYEELIGDYLESDLVEIQTGLNGRKSITFLGYCYRAEDSDGKEYRIVNYVGNTVDLEDFINDQTCRHSDQYNEKYNDDHPYYIGDANANEVYDYYASPSLFPVITRAISDKVPDGTYIWHWKQERKNP